jgi:ribosome-associated heat shock protein Hsp15
MRVDLYLKRVCLLKSRTLAREACDRGKVLLNGSRAKGSSTVAVGDRIVLDLGRLLLEVEVASVPEGSVSKNRARECYTVLKEEHPAI